MIILINCKSCGEKSQASDVHCLRKYYFAFFSSVSSVQCLQFSVLVTDTNSLVTFVLETYATISPNVNVNFQLWKLTHTSAYYLLQNLNYLNCIQRFVRSFEQIFESSQIHFGLMRMHNSKFSHKSYDNIKLIVCDSANV